MKQKCKMKKAIEILQCKGLVYCSTKKQKENGTLYFVDPKTMTGYSITKSGYCRRHTFHNYAYGKGKMGEAHYQLNKTVRSLGRNSYGNKVDTVKRLLFPEKYVKLAKQLTGPIENWRK